jgi:hypothetical protein
VSFVPCLKYCPDDKRIYLKKQQVLTNPVYPLRNYSAAAIALKVENLSHLTVQQDFSQRPDNKNCDSYFQRRQGLVRGALISSSVAVRTDRLGRQNPLLVNIGGY